MTKSEEIAFLKLARERYADSVSADKEESDKALSDLKFLDGDQWDDKLKAARKNRPCLVMDKLNEKKDQVAGELAETEVSIKAIPVSDQSNKAISDVITGIIKNIEIESDAEEAYISARASAVSCGRGFFRILTDYVDDESFEQKIVIEPIKNCFSVRWDPMAEKSDKSDGDYWFIDRVISRDRFKSKWPDKTPADFENESYTGNYKDWVQRDTVRIAEYFVKEVKTEKLYFYKALAPEGSDVVSKEKLDDVSPSKTRVIRKESIKHYIIDGTQILEENDWAGKWFPIIAVWGKTLNINGEEKSKGVVRNAKDPQRVHNYWWSSTTETVALAPKSPWLATPKQIGQYQKQWNSQFAENYPYLLYDPDERVPGSKPSREAPPSVPTGQVQLLALAADAIKSSTGIYDASLGARSNETSGRAIQSRQQRAGVANIEYAKNFKRAMVYAGKVIVDLIPKIYDTPRVVRIIKPDNKEEFVTINQMFDGNEIMLKDIKLESRVEVGPSYTTLRQETAQSMMSFAQTVPGAAGLISDLIVGSMDWAGSQEAAERLKRALPPQVTQNPEGGDQGQPQGQPQPQGAPPEVAAEQKAKLDQEVAKAMEAKLDVQIKKAKLEAAKAKAAQEEVKITQEKAKTAQIVTNNRTGA